MKNAELRTIPLVTAAALLLIAAGCKDEENLHACHELCKNRILCEEERGNSPPSQTGCETACLGLKGEELVARTEVCVSKASCDYVACVDSDIPASCSALCENRILCEEERGNSPPSKASCETECLESQGSDGEARAEACADETSCDYVACASSGEGGGGGGGAAP
ncbi:hypothetical protein [Sorangium sp. So ce131]|uniref:hypothetical protein n=1 Tax=Sorangium sp. So ce131 TaxID=3133282 RepID=UPI003F616F0A